jgi:hypothetical protein
MDLFQLSTRTFRAVTAAIAIASAVTAADEEFKELKAKAPDGYTSHRDVLEGSYWIPNPLKEKYDTLVSQVKALRKEILEERIDEAEARRRIEALKRDLDATKREIQEKEVLIAPAKVSRTTETQSIQLGPDGCLLVEADRVRIVGWQRPDVECVVERVVLSDGEVTPTADLEGIRLIHRRIAAEEVVPKYLLGPAPGADRGPEDPIGEKAFLLQPVFGSLAGKIVDAVRIQGLTAEEGNRCIGLTMECRSSIAGKTCRSVWKRTASMTIHVPACKVVAVRGALRGLEAESVASSLAVTDDGGWDRDYGAACSIRGLGGSLTARDIPISLVEDVKGNVSIAVTKRLENVTTFHEDGKVTQKVEEPRESIYRNIGGDFRGWFARANLRLEKIGGAIDVRNDAFETVLVAGDRLPTRAHRIVSEMGHIRAQIARGSIGDLPVTALSESGFVRIPADLSGALELRSFSTPGADGVSRSWEGFTTKIPGAERLLESFQRPDLALRGVDRPAGLDLISRMGSVRIDLLP